MMINATHIYKEYRSGDNRVSVLKGVSLQAEPGDFLALVGASGAGKSTLLHVLGGLDRPDRGQVVIDRVNLYKIKESARAQVRNRVIGFVFQFYHLLPELNAVENVMLAARVRGVSASNARSQAVKLLQKVGLEKRSRHRPSELSGGEQQRVALARALINDPRILLCDEPTGNLDSRTGARICELLRELNRESGYTIIVVTHAPEVAELARRTQVIKDGVLADG